MADPNKNIHTDHRERLHRRFLENGFRGLAGHEALEYMLTFSIPRKDVNPLAHRLIDHFGDFCRVLEASEAELQEVEGVGPATARLLAMVMEASRYYQHTRSAAPRTFEKMEQIAEFVVPLFHGARVEQVYGLYFDDRNSLIKWERLAEGGSNESAVSPRALAQRAVRLGATQVVLAHNHPGGLALPSQADLDFTASVGKVLYPLGIRLLDHIIVDSEGDYLSMEQTRRLPELGFGR